MLRIALVVYTWLACSSSCFAQYSFGEETFDRSLYGGARSTFMGGGFFFGHNFDTRYSADAEVGWLSDWNTGSNRYAAVQARIHMFKIFVGTAGIVANSYRYRKLDATVRGSGIGPALSVGNVLRFANGLFVGQDWIGVHAPIIKLSHKVEYSEENRYSEKARREIENTSSKNRTLFVMRLNIGYQF